MGVIKITKGRNIQLKGVAESIIVQAPLPAKAAIMPLNYRGLKARLLVKEGDAVKVGTSILEDKSNTDIKFASPVSGTVAAVNRGAKRALLSIVVDVDGKQEALEIKKVTSDSIAELTRDDVISAMLPSGLWPILRQRPFSCIANPEDKPKSIFVQAMNTEPLALNIDKVIDQHKDEFQFGLRVLAKLTDGPVNVCYDASAKSAALTQAKDVSGYQFSGPHPAGNVSTHIHYIDPINKGDIVWYVSAQDVIRLGSSLNKGSFDPIKYVAITGEGANKRHYAKTILGASVRSLVDELKDECRYISGSVLTGSNVGMDGFVGFYDSQITVIPEGGQRQLLGWMVPGFSKYTFSQTFASAFLPQRDVSLDADENGSHRAIVINDVYDRYNTLDIMTYFLVRAVLSGDIEESEALGILECDEEDFALATFACPSKTDVGAIIRRGLDTIQLEG